ncbi:MAG: hypothetical protein V1838_03670 [Patescibacteria group bacterium]
MNPVTANREHMYLAEMIKRYPEAKEEDAPGLIHAIAKDYSQDGLIFLMKVGDELSKYEPNGSLRSEARKALVRKTIDKTLKKMNNTEQYIKMVNNILTFFASHPEHAGLPSRDLGSLNSFLGQCYEYTLETKVFNFDKDCLIKSLVNARHYRLILGKRLYGAIPHMYQRLCQVRGVNKDAVISQPESRWLQEDGLSQPKPGSREMERVCHDAIRIITLCGDLSLSIISDQLKGDARALLELATQCLHWNHKGLIIWLENPKIRGDGWDNFRTENLT